MKNKEGKIRVRYKHLLTSGQRLKLGDGKSVTFTHSFEEKEIDEKYRPVIEAAPDFEIVEVKTKTGGTK